MRILDDYWCIISIRPKLAATFLGGLMVVGKTIIVLLQLDTTVDGWLVRKTQEKERKKTKDEKEKKKKVLEFLWINCYLLSKVKMVLSYWFPSYSLTLFSRLKYVNIISTSYISFEPNLEYVFHFYSHGILFLRNNNSFP